MASIITATTANGLVSSADNSGVLQLASGTGNLVTVPSVTGTAMVSSNMPAFSAYHSTSQTLTVDTLNKILFNTELFDTNNNFSSSRFTPTVAGYYQCSCGIRADNNPIGALHVQIRINNTSPVAQGSFTNTGLASFMTSCSGLVYLNGSTDFVEVYCYTGTSGTSALAGVGLTYFQGAMVRAA
jgi:hypothetical protein